MRREVKKAWPALADTKHLGKRTERLDGAAKVTGKAIYTADVHRPGMLYLKFTLCPHGRAEIREVDVTPAIQLPGVVVARALMNPGDETHYAGYEVAVVAAETEEVAREAARLVKVQYNVLEHNVIDDDPEVAEEWRSTGRPRVKGDVDQALASADLVVEGRYGVPVVTHCCFEPHGSVIEFKGEERIDAWFSTQRISSIVRDLAGETGVDVGSIHGICHHLGSGYGAKFQFDVWDRECARIAEESGRPVKVTLDRDHELMVAGSRPSAYANVRVGVSKDGQITAWDSQSFGTNGDSGGGGRLGLPYIFEKMPNRQVHTAIKTNTGPARAWRAPSHPQLCLITMSALEDAAAALGIDPLEFFRKNLHLTGRPELYAEELGIAADLIGWHQRWHPRGAAAGATGPRRTGLGLSIHTWGGRGHDSNCRTTLYADGRVDVACATQDLGTGARTVLAVVTAETLGVPIEKVNVLIGDSLLPPSGASGGSTTTGGIATSSRTAAVDAINQLIARVAPELGATSEECVVADGRIQVQGAKERSLSYQDACRLIGAEPIIGNGRTDPELMTEGVGGVQMAEVAVDMETGVVEMVKLVAVQDCGTVVNLQTAESQVLGACIMGISTALFEERVMDPLTGDCLNPHLTHYRLAGIGDVGEIVVHLLQNEEQHRRGVIGLGEPPVISPVAAISNAVANATGVRVGTVPLTPAAVLTALGGV